MANFLERLFRPDAYVRVMMTDKERRTLIIWGVAGVLTAMGVFGWLSTQDVDSLWGIGLFYLSPIALIGLIALAKAVFFPFNWTETAEETERQRVAAEEAAKAPDPLIEGPWYVRYPFAIVGGWVFTQYLLPRLGPEWNWVDWIIVGGVALFLLIIAREVALVVLGIGAIWFVLRLLSDVEITTPGAIIIGAVVIAYAIFATNSRRKRPRKKSRRLGRRA